jgi:hypothetical protein
MEKSICPFLGLKEDPDSVLNFPSQGNCCHHANPITPVTTIHQSKFCLTSNYLRCPVYITDKNAPLPPELVGKYEDKQPSKNIILIGAIISILTITIVVILFMLRNNGSKFSTIQQMTITATSKDMATNIDTPIPQGNTTMSSGDSSSLMLTPDNELIICVPPENWILYTVKPTDSLVRLALIFNITVEDLQKANCMMDRTLLKPGEEIYIPGSTPTVTVSTTPTVTITNTYRPPVIPTRTFTVQPTEPPRPRPTNTIPPPPPPPPTNTIPPPPPTIAPTEPEPTPTPNPEI